MKIIVIALQSHAGIFFERIIRAQPIHDRLHALIVFLHVCVDITEQSRVADAAIGTERDAAVRVRGTAGFTALGIVNKATAVLRIVRDPRLFVRFRKILAIANELNRRGPVQVFGVS